MWWTEESIETTASAEAIWRLWADVPRWPDWIADIEHIELSGPFVTGSKLSMTPICQDPVELRIEEAIEPELFIDVAELGDVVVRTIHRVERLNDDRNRVAYRMEITGPGADRTGPELRPGDQRRLSRDTRRARRPGSAVMTLEAQLAGRPLPEMLASRDCGTPCSRWPPLSGATTVYDWLVFGRGLAAMIWLGVWATLSVPRHPSSSAEGPRRAGTIRRRDAVRRPAPPATVLVAGLGVWLVLDSHQWHFRQLWSERAIGLFAGVLVIDAGFQSGSAIGTERAIAGGNPDRSRGHVAHWAWAHWRSCSFLLSPPGT